VVFKKEHQGWDSIVHGGLLTCVLDDVMAHTLFTIEKFGITASMKIRWKKPVYVGEKLYLEGSIIKLKSKLAVTKGIGYTKDINGNRILKCEAEASFYLDSPKSETET